MDYNIVLYSDREGWNLIGSEYYPTEERARQEALAILKRDPEVTLVSIFECVSEDDCSWLTADVTADGVTELTKDGAK